MNKQFVDWSDIENFSPGEFPAGVLEKIEPGFIYALEFFRVQLGCIVNPSPLVGGWIREGGSETSRHYVGNGRKSDAGDVFCDCDPFHALIVAIRCGFTGIGLYFDTKYDGKPHWMLHLDKRPTSNGNPVIWVRDKSGKYTTISPRPTMDVVNFLKGAM